MKILKVWDYEYPWDVRTEKVCRALTDMGHDVHLLARNRRGDPLREDLPEAYVHRMRSWSVMGPKLDAASQFPAFVNPRWASLAFRTAREKDVDLIVVRELPLAPIAVAVAGMMDVPVILDMAEHYAAMIRDLWDTGLTRFGDVLVRNPRAVVAVERWTMARVDHTVVVIDESKERLVADGTDPDTVTVVSNTPYLSRVEELKAYASLEDDTEVTPTTSLRLIYLGVMEEARGVSLVIRAVAAARQAGTPVTLDLIGSGRSLDDFCALAAELGLGGDAFASHGFIDYHDALKIVATKDAGLVPHFASEGWESTIPNKLFDYMSLGVPVISSDVTPVTRVLSESGAGVTFKDRDVEDLTRVIREMQANLDRKEMGRRGLEAVRARYNWDLDSRALGDVIDRVMTSRR